MGGVASSPILANPSLLADGLRTPLDATLPTMTASNVGRQIKVSRVLSVKRDTKTGDKTIRLRDDQGRSVTLRLGPRQFSTLAKNVTAEQLALQPGRREAQERDSAPALIEAELRAAGGNVSRTARRLGVPRSTLRYWIGIYGLEGLVPLD